MPLSTDTSTVLWTLRHGHRRLECSIQLLPHGRQLHLALNGDTPYCSRTFQTQDEWLAARPELTGIGSWKNEQRRNLAVRRGCGCIGCIRVLIRAAKTEISV